ncbi:BlaI/MecI/CopY family transcriptional regulator [bacterium]|nr:BlaI/MecI/CopY family transcriptional regulator [bacterium]
MAVLDQVWHLSEERDMGVSVQEVLDMLSRRELAYTTVMTVLGNLHKKGLLAREKSGKSYLYRPLRSRESVTSGLLSRLGKILFAGSKASWLACLLGPDASLSAKEIQELKARLAELESRDD